MPFCRFLPLLCLLLPACTPDSDSAAGPTQAPSASAEAASSASPEASASADVDADPSPGASASATAAPGGANKVKEQNELYSFAYSWPAAAGDIPALARRLQADLETNKRDLASEAKKGKEDAEDNGFPYNPHYYSEEWKVVADLPDWLSLTGDFSTYTGGAHGNYGLETLVWDKNVGRGFPAAEMFVSADALGDALGDKLCKALDREREKRRGEPVKTGEDATEFDECPGIDEATVLVGSSNGRSFNRIGVWFGPYVAGPYAEGAYELTFPVDKAILDTVKPGYRSAFAVRR